MKNWEYPIAHKVDSLMRYEYEMSGLLVLVWSYHIFAEGRVHIAIRVVLLSSPVIWKRLLVEAPSGGAHVGFFVDV